MSKPSSKAAGVEYLKRSSCPITNSLELIGDKWTLVVIRDLFFGKKTYGEFQQSAEGIPTNILADRLKRLEMGGILEKIPYQQKPVRYEYRLTEQGRELGKVLKALKEWGLKYIPGTDAKLADNSIDKQ